MANIELIEYLKGFILPQRLATIENVLSRRTNYMTVVLEDIYQSQNANAVLRTCECFGIQDVHIVENRNPYIHNVDVVRGSTKWLTMNRYKGGAFNTPEAFDTLRSRGYRIVVTSPHTNDVELPDFDIYKGKFAVVIGNEREGVSRFAMDNADEYLRVPMDGFTESLNLSVCTAVIVNHLIGRIRSSDIDYHLSEDEKMDLLQHWLLKSIKRSDLIVKRFLEGN
jgi:tRNA (guanosine-2'-O-)-methyltransferase